MCYSLDYPTSHLESVLSTPSSTLSSKHVHVSKKRIQDYIRQLNQTSTIHTNASNELTAENELNTSYNTPNSKELKCDGLLLQVIDNFVSCTIDSIDKRINQIRNSNESKAPKNVEENKIGIAIFEVMKNVRQFISGVKNYLIKTGEGNLHIIMQEERSKVSFYSFFRFFQNVVSILYQTKSNYFVT